MRYDLAGPEHDVDRPPDPDPVRRSYVLCTNPRTGSSLLAEGLHAVGLGKPIEYFDPTGVMQDLLERWKPPDLRAYIRELHRRRTTRDGVFGAKVHLHQLQRLAGELGVAAAPGAWGGERAALDVVFPAARFVRVRRQDRDRQAVSWMVAEATGRWGDFGTGDDAPQVGYDFEAIDAARRRIDESEDGWSALFVAGGIEPLVVEYRELADAYPETLTRVARFLGAAVEPRDVARPRLRRQADEQSERLLRRYRNDRASRNLV